MTRRPSRDDAFATETAVPLRQAPPLQVGLAVGLACLAGVVDAIGFMRLGGLFVSFMSGNSTRLGVFAAAGDLARVVQIGGLILSFVLGAGFGSGLARRSGRWAQPAVLLLEALVLAAAVGASAWIGDTVGTGCMAFAMGLENAMFLNRAGETRINLTFMTGALVKVGEGLATAALGGPRWDWLPFLLLWAGLTAGACLGAFGYSRVGMDGLLAVSASLAALATILFARRHFSAPEPL